MEEDIIRIPKGTIELKFEVCFIEPAFVKAMEENPPLLFPVIRTENGVYYCSKGTWSGAEKNKRL